MNQTRRGRRGYRILLGLLGGVAILALLEGAASLFLVGRRVATRTNWRVESPQREFVTSFDPELGWCANPGFSDPTGYGAGAPVTVSAQGFRGRHLVEPSVAPGRVRALASGDSFTFGTGVGDDATWVKRLEGRLDGLETVNLGVGGYGIDQAWMRYRRDGAALDHQLHLFAFISEDILRAVIPTTWGAAKPRVIVEAGAPLVQGVPVERVSRLSRTMQQAGGFLRELRLVEAAESLLGTKSSRPVLSEDDEARELALVLFADLARLADARNCSLVLIHLPVESEYHGGSADVLRHYFRSESARHGIAWIDLFDEFRALSPADHASLYVRPPALGAGHYNAKGSEFVADLIARKLREIPAVRAQLDAVVPER